MSTPHKIVVGLGYGDEGKGGITDYLCSPHVPDPARLVVRFNGGPQAAHNVVTDDDRHHTFSQFGSGTLQGAHTHLSRFMMINPLNMMREADHLVELGISDPFHHVTADPRALIVTPYHIAINRWREEQRGEDRHGSCGEGIWETAVFAQRHPLTAFRVGHLTSHLKIASKLTEIRRVLTEETGTDIDLPEGVTLVDLANEYWAFAAQVRGERDDFFLRRELKYGPAVFEGAQGVLIDQDHGCMPYVTGSTTTFANALTLLAEAGQEALRIGVTRTYMTRHGAGPFPTEDPAMNLPELHNTTGPWQGPVRQGHLDLVALRYALRVCGGADLIAMTHEGAPWRTQLKLCVAYSPDGDIDPVNFWEEAQVAQPHCFTPGPREFFKYIERLLEIPIGIYSDGPRAVDKYQRTITVSPV